MTAGGEDWFYLGDPKDNFIYNLEGVNSGTTYAYYDMDDNCLGYAQTVSYTHLDVYKRQPLWNLCS